MSGSARDVSKVYLDHLFGRGRGNAVAPKTQEGGDVQQADLRLGAGTDDVFATRPFYRKDEYRWGDGGAKICDYVVHADAKEFPSLVRTHQRLRITYKVAFARDVARPLYGLLIKTLDGVFIYATNSDLARSNSPTAPVSANEAVVVSFEMPVSLNTGSYLFSVGVTELSDGAEAIPLDRRYDSILIPIENSRVVPGQCDLDADFKILA